MSKAEIQKAYGNSPINFPKFKKNYHNCRWEEGDWYVEDIFHRIGCLLIIFLPFVSFSFFFFSSYFLFFFFPLCFFRTDDTDQMILILETLLETKTADPIVYAKKLLQYVSLFLLSSSISLFVSYSFAFSFLSTSYPFATLMIS